MSDRSMSWDYETTTPGRVIHCTVLHNKDQKQYTLIVYPQTVKREVWADGTVWVSRTMECFSGYRAKLQDCERFNRGRLEELRYAAPHLPITNQMIREVCEKHNLELKKPEGSSVAPEMQAH